jgi:hypothetical protein
MAEDQNILGGLSDVKGLLDAGKWLMNAGGGASVGTGGLLPGGITAYQGPGSGAAVATGSTLAAAAPFLGVASFVLPKILGGMFGDKPKIGFSGTQPLYGYNNGKYYGPQQDKKTQASTIKPSSEKYDYVVGVSETGKDGEIEKQLVEAFDQYFDVLSSQGIPVNDLLARNKNFRFGGRLDKGTTPESVLNDFIAHSLPDIEAYQAGVEPPERQIRVEPKGTVNGMAGRTADEMGIKNSSYSVVVGPDGAQRNKTVRLSINDPRVALIKAEKKGLSGRSTEDLRGSLTPGFTYVVDASKLPGKTADDLGLSGGLRYTVPDSETKDTSSKAGVLSNVGGDQNITGGILSQNGGNMNYSYNANAPTVWEDYVNSVYDQMLSEMQKQKTGMTDAVTKAQEERGSLLNNQQGLLDNLISELSGNKMSRMVGGQKVTWTPKPNRDTAFGLFDKQNTAINTGMENANQSMQEDVALASNQPVLNYLEKLKELADMETVLSAKDKGLALNRDELQARTDAAEPGVLDYIKGIGTAGAGISDIVGLGKDAWSGLKNIGSKLF